MGEAKVGIIGGSGLYEIEGLHNAHEVWIDTPYGRPSDQFVLGILSGVPVAFLPRHGKGHRLSPSELPTQANIWAFKALGVTHLLSISAVGSLRQDYAPRDVVIPDQLLDRTKGLRPASFFGEGIVVHVSLADPFCPELRAIVLDAARQIGRAQVHDGGTLVVMEGPQFSTKAESRFYRQIGGDLIGMTALPEAKLAREAGLCYCTIAMVTDYDVWHESEESVSADLVVANLLANVDTAKEIIRYAVPQVAMSIRACGCAHAVEGAVITSRQAMPEERVSALRLLLGDDF
jgi:5'-methylthioadenosine phosphorylase